MRVGARRVSASGARRARGAPGERAGRGGGHGGRRRGAALLGEQPAGPPKAPQPSDHVSARVES